MPLNCFKSVRDGPKDDAAKQLMMRTKRKDAKRCTVWYVSTHSSPLGDRPLTFRSNYLLFLSLLSQNRMVPITASSKIPHPPAMAPFRHTGSTAPNEAESMRNDDIMSPRLIQKRINFSMSTSAPFKS